MKLILLTIFTVILITAHVIQAKVKPESKDPIPLENTVIENNTQKNELLGPEPSYGQLLYENHCLGCHESQMHIRSNTEVTSLAQLFAFVRIRSNNLDLKWKEEEITAVTLFLNQSYYHFSVSQRE